MGAGGAAVRGFGRVLDRRSDAGVPEEGGPLQADERAVLGRGGEPCQGGELRSEEVWDGHEPGDEPARPVRDVERRGAQLAREAPE